MAITLVVGMLRPAAAQKPGISFTGLYSQNLDSAFSSEQWRNSSNLTAEATVLAVSSSSGAEADQTVITVTATAAGAVIGDQTVDVAVTGTNITAGDYTLSNSTITISNGAITGTVTFAVVDDTVVEGTETVTLTISNPSSGITLGATTSQTVTITDNDAFQLQLLHYYGESGTLGITTAPIMGAMIDKFDDEYANTLVLGEGDSFIPGPWLVAGADPSLNSLASIGSTALGRPDIAIMNAFGTDASALGNHEFDFGSPVLQSAIQSGGAWVGAQFPLVTANLNFSADSSLRGLADASLGGTGTNAFAGQETSAIKGKIAPYAVVTQSGEKIGIVGATTYDLLTKTSPNGTVPKDDGNAATDDLQEVAAYIQATVNSLTAQGVNKIIMVDQLDTIERNKLLAPLVSGIDVMIAGGGHERMGDATDTAVAFNGHSADFVADGYPIVTADANGKPTLIVTTDTEYTYLGRLVANFDVNGELILANLSPAINGAYAATEANLQAAYGTTDIASTIIASSTIGSKVAAIANAINNVIVAKDGTVWGYTNVYLEGDRAFGRAQEVNLGDITADANIYVARQALGNGVFLTSHKNGGGLRASIGSIDEDGGKVAPIANPAVGKQAGGISTLDIENALRFDNKLMVFDTTPQGLKNILEYAAGLSAGNGGYMQIGGIRVAFNPANTAGNKVQSIALINTEDKVIQAIYSNGAFIASAPVTVSMVILNFTANGGDGYPIKANGDNFRYLLANGSVSAAVNEALDFTATATFTTLGLAAADILGEQSAFKSYLQAFYSTPATAYNVADTPANLDQRIQNLSVRSDTALQAPTDIALSSTTVLEHSSNGTLVGNLTAIDSGGAITNTFTFSLTNNAGGRFGISGSQLVVADGTLLDYATNASHQVTIRVTDASGAFYNETFTIAVQDTAPVIGVQGNGVSIVNGDSTPDASDDTAFGGVTVGSAVTHTFTISNGGNADLTGVAVSVNGSAFTVASQPAATISAGNSSTFQVVLAPNATGVVTATVSITNSDSTANPYTFVVGGAGVAPQATITIVLDGRPDLPTDLGFNSGSLGAFLLDDPAVDDGDAYTTTKTFSVTPGAYNVQRNNSNSWFTTAIACTPTANATVNLTQRRASITVANGDSVTCTFTVERGVTIRARAFNDLVRRTTNLGKRNAGDPWLAGWTVNVYSAPTTLVATGIITATGDLTETVFSKLRPGQYTVCTVLPAGAWTPTSPSATDPTYGDQACKPVTLNPGQAAIVLFGAYQTTVVASESFTPDDEHITDADAIFDEPYNPTEEEVATNEEAPQIFLPLISR